MATIMKFEEILSWQEARKLNISIGKMMEEKKLGNYINNEEFEQYRFDTLRISSLLQKLIHYLSNTAFKGVKYKIRNKTATTVETSGMFETSETSRTDGTVEPFIPLQPE
jgi:hypothetical protein